VPEKARRYVLVPTGMEIVITLVANEILLGIF
jgi:hypothetical protein